MSTLPPLTANRITCVLDDITKKIQFLNQITPTILSHRNDIIHYTGHDIMKMMSEQVDLESIGEGLIIKRSNLNGIVNKNKYYETQKAINKLFDDLRDNTRKICRTLKENPNVMLNINKSSIERSAFLDLLDKIKTDLLHYNFKSLHIQVEADINEKNKYYEIEQRKLQAKIGINNLHEQIKKEKLAHLKLTKEKSDVIEELKAELKELLRTTRDQTDYIIKESKAKTEAQLYEFRQKEAKITDELNDIQNDQRKESISHELVYKHLLNETKYYEDLVTKWTEKFSVDSRNLDKQIESLTELRQLETDKLNELRARREKERSDEIMNNINKKNEEQAKIDLHNQEQKNIQCAIVIQRAYRQFKLLKAVQDKLKPKKRRARKKDKKGRK